MIKIIFEYFVVCVFAFLCLSCTNDKKTISEFSAEDAKAPQLLDTEVYIPIRVLDKKTGELVSYEAVLNPYLKQRGKINKQSVVKFIEAKRALKSGDFKKAKGVLNLLVNENADLAGPWVMLGDIALHEKNIEVAGDHYKKALQINDKNLNAYIRLAKLRRIEGRFIDSQNTYANALSIWKDFPEAHLNIAILYDIYLNKPVLAQRHLEAYQFLTSGKNTEAASWLAEIQGRTGLKVDLEVEQPKPAEAPAI